MANFMDSVSKGFATLNTKTNNLVETTKLKSSISRKENEISDLMRTMGEIIYINRADFQMDLVEEHLNNIKLKYDEIEAYKVQIAQIAESEKNTAAITPKSNSEYNSGANPGNRIFCTKCGTPNESDSLFCENCGTKLIKLNSES